MCPFKSSLILLQAIQQWHWIAHTNRQYRFGATIATLCSQPIASAKDSTLPETSNMCIQSGNTRVTHHYLERWKTR